ncbi:Centromere/kinetochore protein zw10 -like protein [Escovopsis weberi]|uniref:Centromere/kinetochore protein zw10-like protein n=1 Tax=Escovopsis weberi TaxID=150374 RepID=A0A0M8MQ99_ESCWE|nr:Centromere/kinetochore protein zw10 -like protein [Escovopsis weberi]
MAEAQRLGEVILAFSLEGSFPEDAASLPAVSETDPSIAIEALGKAKTDLEMSIRTINEETKDDVSSWVKNAKVLQEDIIRSKVVANDIVHQSEAPDASGQAIQDAETKAEFIRNEAQYNQQLRGVLLRIQHVGQLLAEVDQASKEGRILDALQLLEKSWAALDEVGVSRNTRIVKLLDARAFELKASVHDVLSQAWRALVRVDVEAGQVAIVRELEDRNLSLDDIVVGFKAYKEIDERMEQFWRNLDASFVSPRMSAGKAPLPTIKIVSNVISLSGTAEPSLDALLSDLESVLLLIARELPRDLLQPFGNFMMADIVPRLIQEWLNPAIPSGLRAMEKFQALISRTTEFCDSLGGAGYERSSELQQWADKAAMRWLEKCRETTLDMIRTSLAGGMGESKRVEKIEKQMVSLAEGKELATTGAGAAADSNDWGDGWGDAWDDDHEQGCEDPAPQDESNGHDHEAAEDDASADAWGWDDDADDAAPPPSEDLPKPDEPTEAADDDDDDGTDAWGWGDDAAEPEPEPEPEVEPEVKVMEKRKQTQPSTAIPTAKRRASQAEKEETRELVFKEAYSISSMPQPVLDLIYQLLEDGATLTKETDEHSLVAATAPGLFGLPTFALALFRAISPHYYSLDPGGNMFLYNDATYLAEKLSEFSSSWKQRQDLSPRAQNMLRLDNDVKSLESFANRSYSSEMNTQKVVLQDLIGSSKNVMHQDEKEAAVESGTARIRTMAATWEPILRRSAWSQAVGSLADSLAARIISDVLELSSIGQEEAYSIAKLITSVTELDSLFLPSRLSGTAPSEDEVPTTAQYAPNWLRLKYLGEVLQSNLNEVKYLWCESELSLYFKVDEVVDLIHASFEDNPRTRDTVREIKAKQTQ